MPVIYQRPLSVDGWIINPVILRGAFFGMRQVLGGNRIKKVEYVAEVENFFEVENFAIEETPQEIILQKQPVFLFSKFVKQFLSFLIYVSIAVSISVFAFLAIPEMYYRLVPLDTKPITATEAGTPNGGPFSEGSWFRVSLNSLTGKQSETILSGLLDPKDKSQAQEPEPEPELPPKPTRYLPPKDETLPEGDWISIPRIGVRTQFRDSDNPEEAMEIGVWKVPEYGLPGQLNLPVIMAAHRFGWDWWWQSDYWRYHSFYLLPDTQPGDRVEIISDQRKWVYEIYAGEEGTDITDYEADMILYTCKFLTSPLRHFRYARLIDESGNSQQPILQS